MLPCRSSSTGIGEKVMKGTKAAEIDVDLDEHDFSILLEIIKSAPSAPRVKDGTNYSLKTEKQNP